MSNKHEFKTIVVPYDGSDQAKHAFSMACDLIGDGFNGNARVIDAVTKAVEHFLLHAIEGGIDHVFVRFVIEQAPRHSIDGVAFSIVHCADHA